MEDINLLDDLHDEFEKEMIEEAIAFDEYLEEQRDMKDYLDYVNYREKIKQCCDGLDELKCVKENVKKGAVAYEITYEINKEDEVMKITSFKLRGGQKDIPRTTSKNTIMKMLKDKTLSDAISFIKKHYLPVPSDWKENQDEENPPQNPDNPPNYYVALLFMIMIREGTRVFSADTVLGKISHKLIYRE